MKSLIFALFTGLAASKLSVDYGTPAVIVDVDEVTSNTEWIRSSGQSRLATIHVPFTSDDQSSEVCTCMYV